MGSKTENWVHLHRRIVPFPYITDRVILKILFHETLARLLITLKPIPHVGMSY